MEPEDVLNGWRKIPPGWREGTLVFLAVVFVVALVVLWALFIRKPPRRPHHHSHHHHHYSSPGESGDGASAGGSQKRRWRRRRRDHRPRNPTLAETGGLPPIRSEGPPPQP